MRMNDLFLDRQSTPRVARGSIAWTSAIVVATAVALPALAAPPSDKTTLVVCSPGSPGTTDEAQPRMDALAQAVSARAGTPLAAVYDPSDDGGVARLKTAGIGMVSLPFFLQHEQALGLHPRLQAIAKGRPALERWALVGQKGKVKAADGLAGFTIATSVAFAPGFVRGTVLGGFGALPASVKITQSTAVLSGLRRAANGEPVAVLLDATQESSLASLPFGDKLEVIARSPPLPAGLIVTIDSRMPARTWATLERGLLEMSSNKAATEALDAIQLTGFVALDDKPLTTARKAFEEAAR
jgi:hypothetical protein